MSRFINRNLGRIWERGLSYVVWVFFIYVWVKKCVKVYVMLFKMWKWELELAHQKHLKLSTRAPFNTIVDVVVDKTNKQTGGSELTRPGPGCWPALILYNGAGKKKRAILAPKSVLGIWENGCHSHTDDAFMLMPHHQFPWSGKTYWKATRTRTRRSRKTRFFFKTQLEQQQQQESDRCEGWSWISGVGGSALWSPFQCPQPWQGTWLQNHCGPCSLHDQPFPCPHHWWSHRFPPHPFLSFFLNISYMLCGCQWISCFEFLILSFEV